MSDVKGADEVKLTIPEWSSEDRPREKLMEKGPGALSDAELIAVLIRVGTEGRDAVAVAREILGRAENDLDLLARQSIAEMIRTDGVKKAKAIAIIAALELGRRRKSGTARERPLIRSSAEAFNELHPRLADLSHEQFWLLFLDRGNRMIGAPFQLSDGGMHGTVADPKRIFKEALDHRCSSMVLAHNHPSGQLRPSEEDILLTKKLVEGGRLLDVVVQDHLIITTHGYFSFADQGMI